MQALLFGHLKLDRFILVMQDWGGPIGLSIATRHPDIARWRRCCPDVGVQQVPQAHHYTQEDCPQNDVIAIRRLLQKR